MFTECWPSRQILRILYPEDKGTKIFRNVCHYLPVNMM